MALYTLHLGFSWNSPLIGSIWGNGSVSGTYRFLQYALADNNKLPAWFQFVEGDALSVTVWDLTSSPVAMALDLDMSLSYLDASRTYNPSSYMDVGQSAVSTDNDQYYFEFSTISGGPQATAASSPWGDCASWYAAMVPTQTGLLTFTKTINCKLSFRLNAAQSGGDSGPRLFISDPEVIVGARG